MEEDGGEQRGEKGDTYNNVNVKNVTIVVVVVIAAILAFTEHLLCAKHYVMDNRPRSKSPAL